LLLASALKAIPLGTGYAVWVGIGAVGTALVGMLVFREPATVAPLLCIGLIVAGIAGLKLTSARPRRAGNGPGRWHGGVRGHAPVAFHPPHPGMRCAYPGYGST